MRNRNVCWFAGIGFAAVSVLTYAMPPAAITAANLRKPAPELALADSKGVPVRLSDYKGKVVLLDFWATWCGGCKVEIPWFMEFADKYKDGGLTVIGVSMDDEGWKIVKPFLEQKHIHYPVVIGTADLAKRYALGEMPMTLLIGRDGKIAARHDGMAEKGAFENEIQTLLRESGK